MLFPHQLSGHVVSLHSVNMVDFPALNHPCTLPLKFQSMSPSVELGLKIQASCFSFKVFHYFLRKSRYTLNINKRYVFVFLLFL